MLTGSSPNQLTLGEQRSVPPSRLDRFSLESTVEDTVGARISALGEPHRLPSKEMCRPGTALLHPMTKGFRDCTRPRFVKES